MEESYKNGYEIPLSEVKLFFFCVLSENTSGNEYRHIRTKHIISLNSCVNIASRAMIFCII